MRLSKAIEQARKNVSGPHKRGFGQYCYSYYSPGYKAWVESPSNNYYITRARIRQARIDEAGRLLDIGINDTGIGRWEDVVRSAATS